jgi:acyl carrier protein
MAQSNHLTAGKQTAAESDTPSPRLLQEEIRDFVLANYLFTTDTSAVGLEDSLLDRGIVDSTGMLEIIFFIEERFGVVMDDQDMIPENLASISKIAGYVESKLQSG